MSNIFLGVLFLIGTFFDIKFKALPKWFLTVAFLCSLILYAFVKPVPLWEMVGGIIIGGVMLVISYITKGALGFGDGLFLIIAAIHLGVEKVIAILTFGLFLSAIFSVILLILRKVSRKTALPFVPFMALGYLFTFVEAGGRM